MASVAAVYRRELLHDERETAECGREPQVLVDVVRWRGATKVTVEDEAARLVIDVKRE